MIKKVRRRFMWIATLSLFLVMIISFASLIGISVFESSREADQVLSIIVKNNGRLDVVQAKQKLGDQYNREGMFKYRYFTANINTKTQKMKVIDDGHIVGNSISSVNNRTKQLTLRLKSGQMKGTIRSKGMRFRYLAKKISANKYYVCFIDLSPLMQSTILLAKYALIFTFGGILFFIVIMALLADRAVQPIKEAYEKQRRFITNAGHELKTPLAVISANAEMEEILGNDEWNESTKEQVVRMTGLINQLITLTRMSEPEEIVLSKINFSETAKQSAESFKSVLAKDHKKYTVNIDPDLYVNAEQHSLLELVNILIDNAQKYCDPEGEVTVNLTKSRLNQNAVLTVSNSYKNGADVDTNRFFERFYREDESHHYDHEKKSGFGIGLSMAQDLVATFGGKINANWSDGVMNFTVTFKRVH
ncbi:sensor histidine kinase [Lactobacillus nasalidis]|nr:HAMP domain-containing sensor histidine kinase [Lactobacillus nasalidis]